MERRFTSQPVRGRYGWVSLLLVGLVLSIAGPSQAQGQADTLSSAERIEQMRDQSAQPQAQPNPEQPAEPEQEAAPLPANEQLPLGPSDGGMFASEPADGSKSGVMGDGWVMSTLAALGVVLALVYGLRWLLRRGGVVSTSVPQGGVVEVLSRTTVAPRSHVVLLRIGGRVLVVNDSQSGMRTLAALDDPEEVAELLGAIEAGKATSLSQSFSGVMKRLSGSWPGVEQELEDDAQVPLHEGVEMDRTRGAVSSVRGRLAALAGVGGKS